MKPIVFKLLWGIMIEDKSPLPESLSQVGKVLQDQANELEKIAFTTPKPSMQTKTEISMDDFGPEDKTQKVFAPIPKERAPWITEDFVDCLLAISLSSGFVLAGMAIKAAMG